MDRILGRKNFTSKERDRGGFHGQRREWGQLQPEGSVVGKTADGKKTGWRSKGG